MQEERTEAVKRTAEETNHSKENVSDHWRTSTYVKIGIMLFFTFLACILVFFGLLRYQGIFSGLGRIVRSGQSIVIGLVLAYLLNPVMRFFESRSLPFLERHLKTEKKAKKVARAVGVTCSVCLLLLVIGLLIAAIVPAVIGSVMTLVDTLPGHAQSFLRWLRQWDFGNETVTEYISTLVTNATNYLEEIATEKILPLAQTYLTQITSGVYSVVRAILNFVIGIIVAIYVMSIKETLIGQSKKLLYAVFKPKHCNLIIEVVREADKIFGGFISGKILDSAIIGCVCYIGCLILRIPDAVLVAVVVGVTNIIPFFGPFIGAVPSIFLVVVQSPIHALYLAIFIVILQQVDGNIIGPKILGDSIGLSTFWVMFAILVGGGNFGFLGMVLGVPVMGVIYYVMRRLVNFRVRKRKLSENTADYIRLRSVDEKNNEMIYAADSENTASEDGEGEADKL